MPRLQLEISTPAGNSTLGPLDLAEYIIGRDPKATLCLDDPRTSRRHARIFLQGDTYAVEDAGSANGILVDDRLLRGSQVLQDGMRIVLGSCTLTVRQLPEQRLPTPSGGSVQGAGAADGAGGRYVLVAINGPRPGSTYALTPGELSLGRDSQNQISIDDASISRRHATIRVEADRLFVADLNSSNGTFIGDQRLSGEQALRPGNRLRLGQIAFDVVSAGAPIAVVGPFVNLQPSARPLQLFLLGGIALAAFVLTFQGLSKRRGPQPDWRGAAEIAEQVQLDSLLQAGEQAAQSGDWQAGLSAYRQALRLDPVNPQARAGLTLTEQQRVAAQVLQRARQAMNQGMPLQALNVAAGFPESQVDGKISEFFAQAGRAAAAQCLKAADAACRVMRWPVCQLHAATLLLYLPQNAAARALVQEAENGLRTARRAYRSFPVGCGDAWRQLPQSDVREAALRYASGDPDSALRRLANYRVMPGANRASQQIRAIREAYNAGEKAHQSGNLTASMGYFARGIELHDSLLGRRLCSVWGSRLRDRLAAGLLRSGQQAFDRGQYPQAFREWQRAQRYEADNAEIGQALQRLENRAASLIGDIATLPALDAAACARLQTVLSMTVSSSAAHRAALGKLKECRSVSEDSTDFSGPS